jgi:hypothetical protein
MGALPCSASVGGLNSSLRTLVPHQGVAIARHIRHYSILLHPVHRVNVPIAHLAVGTIHTVEQAEHFHRQDCRRTKSCPRSSHCSLKKYGSQYDVLRACGG